MFHVLAENGKIIGLQCDSLASADSPARGKICVLPGPLCALKSNFHHPLGHLPPEASSNGLPSCRPVYSQCHWRPFALAHYCHNRNLQCHPTLATPPDLNLSGFPGPSSGPSWLHCSTLRMHRGPIYHNLTPSSPRQRAIVAAADQLYHIQNRCFFFALRFTLLNYYPVWNRMLSAFFGCQ